MSPSVGGLSRRGLRPHGACTRRRPPSARAPNPGRIRNPAPTPRPRRTPPPRAAPVRLDDRPGDDPGHPGLRARHPLALGLYGPLRPRDEGCGGPARRSSWRWRRRSGSATAGCCSSSASTGTGSASRCASWMMLVAANVLYTAPVTVAGLLALVRAGRHGGRCAYAAAGGADQRDLRAVRDARLRDAVPDPRARASDRRGWAAAAPARPGRAGVAEGAARPALPLQQPEHAGPPDRRRRAACALRFCDTLAEVYPLRAGQPRARPGAAGRRNRPSCRPTTGCWAALPATSCRWTGWTAVHRPRALRIAPWRCWA